MTDGPHFLGFPSFVLTGIKRERRNNVSRQQGGHFCQGDVHGSLDVSILGVGSKYV
jgi:hypothetical protein